jgi:hypothetical protein
MILYVTAHPIKCISNDTYVEIRHCGKNLQSTFKEIKSFFWYQGYKENFTKMALRSLVTSIRRIYNKMKP